MIVIMVAKASSSASVERGVQGFKKVLGTAILEWVLILMLLVDALFSFMVRKFAGFFKLQTPCLLCSRLDHVIGNEKPEFYWESLCDKHNQEISSLVLAKEKGDNSGTNELLDDNKLLVDIVHRANELHISEGITKCSNCSQPSTSRSKVTKINEFTEVMGIDSPLMDFFKQESLQHHDRSKKNIELPSSREEVPSSSTEVCGSDPVSHVGYSELLVVSDADSEVQFSDNEDGFVVGYGDNDLKNETLAQPIEVEIQADRRDIFWKTISDNLASDKLFQHNSVPKPSDLILSSASPDETSRGFKEFDRDEVVQEANDSVFTEIASINKGPSSSIPPFLVEVLDLEEVKGNNIGKQANNSVFTEIASINKGPSSSIPPFLVEVLDLEEVKGNSIGKQANTSELSKPTLIHDSPSFSNFTESLMEFAGSEKLSGIEGEQKLCTSAISELSPTDNSHLHYSTAKHISEVQEETGEIGLSPVSVSGEVFTFESGLSTASGPDVKMDQVVTSPLSSLIDLSDAYKLVASNRRHHMTNSLVDQFTAKDTVRASNDLKLLLSQLSAARGIEFSWTEMSPRLQGSEEDLKAFDASSSAGMQILQKRISLERNESGLESLDGSIVSEIEGESVVDRLKRQIEIDRKSMSAIYKELEEEKNASAIAANQAMAMITKLQGEKAELQMEILQYLRMMEEQSAYDLEALQKANDVISEKEKDILALETEISSYQEKFKKESAVEKVKEPKFDKSVDITKDILAGFGVESLYLSQCLLDLEKKLHLFSNNGIHINMTNGAYSTVEGSSTSSVSSTHFVEDDDKVLHDEISYETLAKEVSDFKGRLKTLESDRIFLEHIINSLGSGNGLQLVQEIAHHLRQIRRAEIPREATSL